MQLQLGPLCEDAEFRLLAACCGLRSLRLSGDWLSQQLPHLLQAAGRAAAPSLEELHLASASLPVHTQPALMSHIGQHFDLERLAVVSVNGVRLAVDRGGGNTPPQGASKPLT